MNSILIIIVVVLVFVSELNSQSVETSGRTGVPNPEYLAKSCKLLTNSTLKKNGLRLYTAQRYLMWPEEETRNSSVFKFTKVAIDRFDSVVFGELHLFQKSSHPQDLKLTVFRLKNGQKTEVGDLTIDENSSGLRIFDIADMSKNLSYVEEDITFTIEAVEVDSPTNFVNVQFVRINDQHDLSKMPLYIHFLNGDSSLPAENSRNSRDVYAQTIENPATEDDRETRCLAVRS